MVVETLLDNDRVLVRRIVAAPGRDVELPDCSAPALLVVIKGGSLTSKSGRRTHWPAGRVIWLSESGSTPAGRSNEGTTSLQLVHVCLKESAGETCVKSNRSAEDLHLNYPNIAGEDVLENDWVIVQRFKVEPGQWEGIHEHVPNMLYVHVKGGRWAARSVRDGEQVYPDASPDGSVGWMPTIELAEGHESGNVGADPIDLVWVTLKR